MLVKILLLAVCLKGLLIGTCNAQAKQDKRYAAVVIDDRTGRILHAKNAYEPRHPASLTKKMTLYLIFQALRTKKITLATKFSTSGFATQQMPCKLGLGLGHTIDVATIIKGLITKSANDVAVVAAEGLASSHDQFIALMNITAKKLGMRNTRFYNSSGVPDRRQVSTAMDMAILARALFHQFPEYYSYFQLKSFAYKGKHHRNHNHMLDSFQGLDGIKTGFTNASGFNISTSALRYDCHNRPHRLFAVVMGGESWRKRDKKAAFLLQEGFQKVGALYLNRSSIPPNESSKQSSLAPDSSSPSSSKAGSFSYINYKDQFEQTLKQSENTFQETYSSSLQPTSFNAPQKKPKKPANPKTFKRKKSLIKVTSKVNSKSSFKKSPLPTGWAKPLHKGKKRIKTRSI